MSERRKLTAKEAAMRFDQLKIALTKIAITSKEDVLRAEAAERDAKTRATRKDAKRKR